MGCDRRYLGGSSDWTDHGKDNGRPSRGWRVIGFGSVTSLVASLVLGGKKVADVWAGSSEVSHCGFAMLNEELGMYEPFLNASSTGVELGVYGFAEVVMGSYVVR